MSKRVQMVDFRGSTQEKWPSEIFRFGYRKAANDKKVPDPVGSEVFVSATGGVWRECCVSAAATCGADWLYRRVRSFRLHVVHEPDCLKVCCLQCGHIPSAC